MSKVKVESLGHTVSKLNDRLYLYCGERSLADMPYDGNFSIPNCPFCGCQVETTGTGPKKRIAAFKRL